MAKNSSVTYSNGAGNTVKIEDQTKEQETKEQEAKEQEIKKEVHEAAEKKEKFSLKAWILGFLNDSERQKVTGLGAAGRWAKPRTTTGTMTADIENPQHPLVKKNTEKMVISWAEISQIVARDERGKLQVQLKQGYLDSVIRPQGADNNRTALHVAVEAGATDCLTCMLEANPSQDILDSPDKDGNTPLHAAINVLNFIAVEKLLAAGVNLNARNDRGFTALHLLAYKSIEATTSDKLTGVMLCTDLLLKEPGIDIEALNNSKMTPLRAAAGKLPSSASSLEEFCKKLVNKGAIIDESRRLLLDKHAVPKITTPAGVVVRPRPDLAPMFDFLIMNQPERISQLFEGKESSDTRKAANWYIGSKKVLYYLVDRCNEAGVRTVLDAGANPWTCNLNGELPLHRALARGNFAIVNLILEAMKTKNDKTSKTVDLRYNSFTLIQKALENQDTNSKHAPDIDSVKCLHRLFESDILLDVNQKESGSINQTALHIAGAMNNQEVMGILLKHGAYLGERRIIGNNDNGTVLKALMPKTLNSTMNECIHVPSKTTNDKNEDDLLDPDYTLEMNYKFLIPPQMNGTSLGPSLHNEAAVLFDVSQSKEHHYAIKHPLIQTLLYAKWRKVFPLYLLNLVLYLTFVILLTACMYTLKNLRILQRMEQTGNYTDPLGLQEQIQQHETTRNIIMCFVVLITMYMAVKEVFQLIFTYKSYFRYIENYLEWFLILVVWLVCLVPLSVDTTKHLAAWAMIAAWYEFVLVLGRAPPLAIYITMLRHVSWNFLKLIFLFGFLIIAFSISFNIILQPSSDLEKGGDFTDFAAFWTTLPRAIVMATGEFEYSSISEELSASALFATSTVLIFLVFLFLIFLVLMNVMTGLAVTDAKEIVEDAILYSLKSRLELVYLNELLFMKVGFLRKLLPRLQLLNNNQRRLLVKINMRPKSDRIIYGEQDKCKLDNRTADVLRNHRLNQLAEQKAEREGNPTERILEILQAMQAQGASFTNNP